MRSELHLEGDSRRPGPRSLGDRGARQKEPMEQSRGVKLPGLGEAGSTVAGSGGDDQGIGSGGPDPGLEVICGCH